MIAGIEIENGSCDPEHGPFRGALSSIDYLIHSNSVQNLTILSSAVPDIWLMSTTPMSDSWNKSGSCHLLTVVLCNVFAR